MNNIQPTSTVNHPPHYTQGGIECIEAIKAATIGKEGFEATLVGNVIKYLWRYEKKNGIEDVEKALWYLARLHKELVEKRNRYVVVNTEKGAGLQTPWGTIMLPKDGDMFNPKEQARAMLLKALLQGGGFCPCQPNKDRDTMCPCKNYRTDGKCICGLFVKVPQDIKEEESTEGVDTENAQTESVGTDTTTEDSKE